jgi:hypothetical protein
MTFITVLVGFGRAARTHLFRLINRLNGPISIYNFLPARLMINKKRVRKFQFGQKSSNNKAALVKETVGKTSLMLIGTD